MTSLVRVLVKERCFIFSWSVVLIISNCDTVIYKKYILGHSFNQNLVFSSFWLTAPNTIGIFLVLRVTNVSFVMLMSGF